MPYTLKIKNKTKQLMHNMQLPVVFEDIVKNIYLPLTNKILDRKNTTPLLISINGAQGTGKSTLTRLMKHLIESNTHLTVANISIDDFYLSREERQQLAETIHPLFITRGVPGTHDIEIMENTIAALKECQPCLVPRFDKALDERCNNEKWTRLNHNKNKIVDIILFEGWCNHSPYQTSDELINPVNELEENEDREGIWRTYANEQLKLYHKKIFDFSDISIMLKAPNFEKVYDWRKLQEQKLQKNHKTKTNSRIMSSDDLLRFIQHFERITRNTLNRLTETVDIVIPVLNDHSIKSIIQNEDFR